MTIAAFALTAALAVQPAESITEIRVHGNTTLSDERVTELAGVAIGAPFEAGTIAAVEKRLRDSGFFDAVEVRKRYRTLEMDQVSLLLVVNEKPGVSATGAPPSAARRLRSHMMFLPILQFDDGYGWTYGARTSFVDIGGKGTRVSVPLSWGATRRATVEADRTFKSGPFTRVSASYGIAQRENPHFEIDDRRTALTGRVERRLFNLLTLGADAGRTNVTFEPVRDSIWTTGADVTLDTRRDPSYPSDAIFTTATWARLGPIGTASFTSPIDRYRIDARGYKRLFGNTVLAVRAEFDTASAPLPGYEQWLLGGSTLRGTPAGEFAGDKRLVSSAELRVPFSSPLSAARVGFNVFFDAGATAAYGERLLDRHLYRGFGGGLWLTAAILNLNVHVAHSPDGKGTRAHFGTGFSF